MCNMSLRKQRLSVEWSKRTFNDVCECEHLCEEDVRMSRDYNYFFNSVTNLDRTIVFLNLLADKIGCDIYEFIFPIREKTDF